MVRPATVSRPAATRSRRWADDERGGHRALPPDDIGDRRLSPRFLCLLADVSKYAVTRMNAFASFMRDAPSVPSTQQAGCGQPALGRGEVRCHLRWIGCLDRSLLVITGADRRQSGYPCPVCETGDGRPDLPPTRACRPSDKTCLMFNVNLLATLSVLSKQVGERPSIALSLSRVVVVGPWIHRNRVTFAVPWPKRRPTW